MPERRRRSRAAVARDVNNTLAEDDYKFSRDPKVAAQRARNRRRRRREAAEAMSGIPEQWTTCVAPGCKMRTTKELYGSQGIQFAICYMHAVAVWESVETQDADPYFRSALDALQARRDEIRLANVASFKRWEEEAKETPASDYEGEIYFVRVRGLIKVGWSLELANRLRSYGPDIELLCHYPGYLADEQLLHKQLSPALAWGREWYEDGDLIAAFVAEAIEKHGPPEWQPQWFKRR